MSDPERTSIGANGPLAYLVEMKAQRAEHPDLLAGNDAARRFFEPRLTGSEAGKQLWVAHLDDGARCLELDRHDLEEGTRSMTIDDILDDAVRLGTSGLLIAQAGRPGDESMIKALAEAAEALDVALVDSLSLDGKGKWHSARRSGRIN